MNEVEVTGVKMNRQEPDDQIQHRVIRYLYGDMDQAQRTSFEDDLSKNALLKEVLRSEQKFQEMIPAGIQPHIDEDRMQGNRWVIREKLRQQNGVILRLNRWWQDLLHRPLVLVSQLGAMTATFALGFLVAGQGELPALPSTPGTTVAENKLSPLLLIAEEDYEIYQLKINNYNASNGDIDLSFALASETNIRGNLSDPGISRLMTVALKNDISDAARMNTIDALQPIFNNSEVYQALIFTLKNDPNPGVRYKAVLALVDLAHVETVREGLRQALSEDINMGIRVEAFNALLNYPDEKTLETFRQRIDADSNSYIRNRARDVIEDIQSGTTVL